MLVKIGTFQRHADNIDALSAGPVQDAVELAFETSLFSVGEAINIQLEGNDVEELRSVAAKIRAKLAEYPGVIDIADSFRSGKAELKLAESELVASRAKTEEACALAESAEREAQRLLKLQKSRLVAEDQIDKAMADAEAR